MLKITLLAAPIIAAGCAYAPTPTPAQDTSRAMKFACEPYGEDEWQWKLYGGNGEPVGWSEGFTKKANCYRAAERAKEGAANAIVEYDTD